MRQVAVAGLGLWLCPPFIVSDLLASGALEPLLTDYNRPEMEIVALYPHRRQLSAKVRLFVHNASFSVVFPIQREAHGWAFHDPG
jgi:DNA-binding transcriptional LysR family regulator